MRTGVELGLLPAEWRRREAGDASLATALVTFGPPMGSDALPEVAASREVGGESIPLRVATAESFCCCCTAFTWFSIV